MKEYERQKRELQKQREAEAEARRKRWEKLCPEQYLDAAKRGDPVSQHNLALCHLFARGTPRNVKEGLMWLEKAAAQNLGDSLAELGKAYSGDLGLSGISENLEKAAALLEKSLIVETSTFYLHHAQWTLGKMYTEGRGVEVDLPRAVALISESAAKGNMLEAHEQKERDEYLGKLQRTLREANIDPVLDEVVITVSLVWGIKSDPVEVKIKAKKKTLLSKLIQAFADAKQVTAATLKAVGPEGTRLKKDMTLRENGLEDGDGIDILLDMDGGGSYSTTKNHHRLQHHQV